jgi:SNF family Na+-dependent transporter
MEPQELANERDRLFENYKSYFSKSAKVRTITFVIFCVLAGLCIFSAVIGYWDWLIGIVGCIIFLVAGSHDIIWYHKLAKADDAQELLTIYDKKRKIEKWTTLTCVLFIIAIIIVLVVISKVDIKIFLLPGALLCLVLSKDPEMKGIERLRELVQATNQS